MSTSISTSLDNLSVVMYNNEPVITTELLAQLYGTESKRIQNNHARNVDRFVEGKHFFKITGSALRELKNRPSLRGSVGNQARSVILWTERGSARHAKILETDQAWLVFEKLEDCYFSKKQIPPKPEVMTSTASLADQLPSIKTYTYQDGRDAIERLRSMALGSLTGNSRELALRDCKNAEEALIKGWTEIDEALIRLSTITGMLRRWRDKN